jgi:IclR family transcriptional regulator, pca regulon regulatory protein
LCGIRTVSSREATTSSEGDHVQSLERGLAVLRAFDGDHAALTLSDVARRTGLTRATARRLLLTFVTLGYMRCDGRRFGLTPKVLDIGHSYLSSLQVGDIAQPFMEAMSERVHESVSCAVLDGEEIVYVARVPTTRIMTISLALGSRLPAFCTSLGRVLLAELPPAELDAYLARLRPVHRTARTVTDPDRLREILADARRQGWTMVDQELEDGVRSIATPLRGRGGRAVAALNCSTHAGRVGLRELRTEFVPALLATAAEIDARLAAR